MIRWLETLPSRIRYAAWYIIYGQHRVWWSAAAVELYCQEAHVTHPDDCVRAGDFVWHEGRRRHVSRVCVVQGAKALHFDGTA